MYLEKKNHVYLEKKNHVCLEKKKHVYLIKKNHVYLEKKNHMYLEKKNHVYLKKKNHVYLKKKNHVYLEKKNHVCLEKKNQCILEKKKHLYLEKKCLKTSGCPLPLPTWSENKNRPSVNSMVVDGLCCLSEAPPPSHKNGRVCVLSAAIVLQLVNSAVVANWMEVNANANTNAAPYWEMQEKVEMQTHHAGPPVPRM